MRICFFLTSILFTQLFWACSSSGSKGLKAGRSISSTKNGLSCSKLINNFFSLGENSFSKLLKNGGPDEFPLMANSLIKDTEESMEGLTGKEYLEVLGEGQSVKTLVKIEHPNKKVQYLVGDLVVDQSFSKEPILILKTKKGIAFLSPESKENVFYSLAEVERKTVYDLMEVTDTLPQRAYSKLTVDDLRKSVCRDFKGFTKSPHYPLISKQLNKYPKKLLFRRIRAINGLQCAGAFPLGAASVFTYVSLNDYRGDGGVMGHLADHNSNFTLGLMFMGLAHQCTKILAPTKAKEILALTLGGNFLMNLHYEVEMGLEESPLTDDKIKNDFNDLIMGIAGIALYGAFAKYIESTQIVNFANLCK